MEEHFFECPYCWSTISMLFDNTVPNQNYIEDCEVCCNPIELHVEYEHAALISLEIKNIEQ